MTAKKFTKAGIVGAGAWGTALAAVCRRAGLDTLVWAFEPEVAAEINGAHENKTFLPGIPLDPAIRATHETARLMDRDVLFLVTPAQFTRGVVEKLEGIPSSVPLVICSKGIEAKSGKLMSEAVREARPKNPLLVLSGPSFAADVAKGKPTAVTLAGEDHDLVHALGGAFGLPAFRPYFAGDIVGAEVGGAIKNVLAIACGIALGKNLGDSARAALITRGLAEMIRFAKARGGKAATLMGLCGLGDTVLTCSSLQSRNFSLGVAIGEGKKAKEILAERKGVTEGVATAAVVARLAKELSLDMPIALAVNAILHEGADVDAAIEALLRRPFSEEAL
ncbi:MAG TPA: NAD(P)H-dependent glycerol-3-phosphate dehydrogenase [Sphingomonadales bacterium]|nr:NAD(P)H-dependent glycerol-3-phosphate dehydrogenase [Sphingomonadales bacterium]